MTQLHILRKAERLEAANIAVILKHHHGDGATRYEVAHDVFGEQVEAQLDVGDGLDDADGYGKDDCNEDADDESPPGEIGWPVESVMLVE